MHTIQLGTSFYVEYNGEIYPLSYEQYLTLCDYDKGRIEADQIAERVAFYKHQHELVKCPLCDGFIRRDLANDPFLLGELHDTLLHNINK